MKRRQTSACIILLTGALCLMAGCAKRETPVEAGMRTQTLLLGNGAEPQDLDPHYVTIYTDQNILMALFEGLTATDEVTSQAVPAAAERWSVSPDGLAWTFHLREGLRWSDGERLTAGDFVQSWRRILAPAFASEYASLLFVAQGAEAFNRGDTADPATLGFAAPDERTVIITLARPTPYLPVLVSLPPWFPINPRVLARFDAMTRPGTAWTRPGNLVGNGPFQLEEWLPNDRIVVGRNPQYWDAARVRLNRIIFFPTENPDVEERNFRAGQVHVTAGVPMSKIKAYRQKDAASLRSDPFLQTMILRFNVTRPPFGDPRVRRALSLAIDRDAIARTVLAGSRPAAHALTPPNTAGYTSRARIAVDYAAARSLLADAGFAGGTGLPVVELMVRNDEIQPKVAEAIQEMWRRELGVGAVIRPVEQKTWIQNQSALNYAVCTGGWIGDFIDPVTFLDLFVSDNGNNRTGWSNAAYDSLIAEAVRTTDGDRRREIFQQAEHLLLTEAPITPLYHNTQTYLIRPEVKGWSASLLGYHRYQNVWLEN